MQSSISVFGFGLIKWYAVPFSTFTILFAISILLEIAAVGYANRKELIPVFSMIPFLILDHSISTYYTMFGVVFAFAILMGKRTIEKKETFLHKHKHVFVSIIIAGILLAGGVIVEAHANYLENFDIRMTNASISYNSTGAVLNAMLNYKNLSNNTIYAYFYVETKGGVAFTAGFINNTLINTNAKSLCDNYSCRVNTNKLVLNGTGTYRLVAVISGNATSEAECLAPVFYNSGYAYLAPGTCASDKNG